MIKYEELNQMLVRNKKVSYPPVPNLYPNKKYANLIYDSFAGEEGELTAITQYIYEHIDLKDKEDISRILLSIAIEEMRHIDILGEILINLGEKPIFRNSNQNQWTAKNVKYKIRDLKDAMKINIASEEAAIRGYRQLMRYTNNMYLRRIYERIILDEMTHLEIFKRILEKCD